MVFVSAISAGKSPSGPGHGRDVLYGARPSARNCRKASSDVRKSCDVYYFVVRHRVIIVSHCSRLFIFHRRSVVVLHYIVIRDD